MRLRKKTLIVVCGTVLVLLLAIYIVSQNVLLSSFRELERQDTSENVERAVDALNREISGLSTFVHDWSAWDDTYAFVQNNNTAYIEANLGDDSFAHYDLNLMAFINSSGYLIDAKSFDWQNQTEVPISQSFLESLSTSSLLWRFNDTNSHLDGILLLQEGPMLISSRPIITSNYQGPIVGAIIMGRNLDSQEISSLSAQVHLSLAVQRFNDVQLPADFQTARLQLSDQEPVVVNPLNSSLVAGYTVLNDVFGTPSLMLRADMPRDIFNQGSLSISYIAFSFLALGLVLTAVLVLLLEKLVLERLAQLNTTIKQIGKSRDLSKRVHVQGKDELSYLSGEFNNMLSALEDSRDTLKKHSEHLEELVQSRTGELRRSEEKIKSILSASPNAVTATDLRGNIVECNEETLRMHGFSSKDELLGKNALQLMVKKDHKEAMKNLKKTLELGRLRDVEYTYVTKDGREFPAELSASIIRDSYGKPIGFVAISEDMTERKKMEQQLVVSRRMAAIGELAGMVGHDLRNPLTSIRAAAYYLKTTYPQELDESGRDMLKIIDEGVEYSNKIINDLLDYSREIKLELTEINPRSIIEKALSLTSIPKNIQVIDSSETEAIVAVDVEKIERVFINIIANAIDAMPEGGTLAIRSWKSDKGIEFAFSDTGIGMSKETLDKIGAPLVTTKARGMGFGLAICKRIVEGHGGHMTVNSLLGKGSIFKITIPVKPKSYEIENSLMTRSESLPRTR